MSKFSTIDYGSEPGSWEQARRFNPGGALKVLGDRPRVLVACEYSATVRDAFRARGFDAWSCDLLPTEGDPRWHIQGDALEAVYGHRWDLLIAHPPCTHLAVSGARWFKDKLVEQAEALAFVRALLAAPISHIALENPVSIISSRVRKPDFTVQPWQFGHGEVKRTCFWTKNLPALVPTDVVEGREAKVHKMAPGPDRWKERSRTYAGIAAAMADQWGDYVLAQISETPASFSPSVSAGQTGGGLPTADAPACFGSSPFHSQPNSDK